jgi:sRNA-binding protein
VAYHPDRDESENIVRMLVDNYPQTFFQEPRQRRPLKKTIVNDLIEDGFAVAREPLEAAVQWYQSHFSYHYALQAGAKRIDLHGKTVGTVTEGEAIKAQDYIAERQREMNERRSRTIADNPSLLPQFLTVAPKKSDPVASLQDRLNEIRKAMLETANSNLRNAFAVAGLGVLINEAEHMIKELRDA